MSSTEERLSELVTIRDWLRYAVSCFGRAGLVYGHGTDNAVDEAAFLILNVLHLPLDQLEPWLDARLTRGERTRVDDILSARVATRKPAPYLTHVALIRGHSFYVDERVIVPRALLGELVADRLSSVVADPSGVERVLDLCTGSGCLAILTALAFPNATIDASDISGGALEVARRNVGDYGLADRIELRQADLFDGLESGPFDLILCNPPYVTDAAIAAFPSEYRAEPVLAHAGGADGLQLVRRILSEAVNHLAPDGHLVMEVGTGRELLEAERPDLPFVWLDTAATEGEVLWLTASALTAGRRRRA